MTCLSQIVKDYRDAGAMNTLINVFGFVDDQVFLTKGGDLGVVFALRGVDDECFDEAQREAVTRDYEASLRLWDPHVRLYQYLLKEKAQPLAEPNTNANQSTRDLLMRRARFLNTGDREVYNIVLYLVAIAEQRLEPEGWTTRLRHAARNPTAACRAWLSTQHRLNLLNDDLERRRLRLRHQVEAFTLQLQDTVRPRLLPKNDAFRFLRHLVNYDPIKADRISLRDDAFVDFHLCDSTLECHRGHLRLDDHYVQVVTLKEPPAHTFPHLWRDLAEMPSPLVLVTEWQPESPGAIRREIHAKRRHFHNARVALTSYFTDAPTLPGERLVDDSAEAVVRDLGACLTEMTLERRHFGLFTMTLVLHDTDRTRLDRSVGACAKALAVHDAQTTDETYNLLNAWLATLPGNAAYNLRSMHLMNTNYADLALVFVPDQGLERDALPPQRGCRVGDPGLPPGRGHRPLAVLETEQHTHYALHLHVDDVGHTLVLGATGAGKSFFMNFLIAHLQASDPRTLIFDLGGSYRRLTECVGGRALHMTLDRPGVTINPFCLPPSVANLQFLFGFVKVLIEASGQYAMSRADDQALYEQLQNVYVLDADQRRLLTLSTILPRALTAQLQPWVQGGQYAAFFDHVEDSVTLAPFQYVDFEGLDQCPQVLEPLLFYWLHRASATLHDPTLSGTLKLFVVDEAWRFLRHPTIRRYVTEALKTWRKKYASVLLATQSSEDLEQSEMLRVAIESCPTVFFLANPSIDRAHYRDLFHLNQTESERITTLLSRQQVLLKRHHLAKVLTLRVDPESAHLFGASDQPELVTSCDQPALVTHHQPLTTDH